MKSLFPKRRIDLRKSALAVLAAGLLQLAFSGSSEAAITVATLTNTSIPFETIGTPRDVTINYTLDAIANVEIDIFYLKNVSDVPSATNQVAQIQQNGLSATAHSVTWSALWLLGGDLGRQDGNFQIILHSDDGTNTSTFVIPQFLQITSVDIHNVSVAPSSDANGNPALPYVISYALAKDCRVTILVKDSLNNVVRTLVSNAPQFGEAVKATNTLTWNGLNDAGTPVPLDIYTVTIDAKDPLSTDVATTRSQNATIQSLANLDSDASKTFDRNSFVYPNPVRDGGTVTCNGTSAMGCFQLYPVRNNATISLKLYTINGDLVLDKTFPGLVTGNPVFLPWNITNQASKKVGRGLYYAVIREQDEVGTLQTVKKLAVIR